MEVQLQEPQTPVLIVLLLNPFSCCCMALQCLLSDLVGCCCQLPSLCSRESNVMTISACDYGVLGQLNQHSSCFGLFPPSFELQLHVLALLAALYHATINSHLLLALPAPIITSRGAVLGPCACGSAFQGCVNVAWFKIELTTVRMHSRACSINAAAFSGVSGRTRTWAWCSQ